MRPHFSARWLPLGLALALFSAPLCLSLPTVRSGQQRVQADCLERGGKAKPEPNRLRVIVETDAGGDPDDEQSLVRFLLYANEWDIEGIIANRSQARDKENLNPERTGLEIVKRFVKAYGECYPNLVKHDKRYPDPKTLLDRAVAGYADKEEGVKLIIAAVDADDPRPVCFLNWGTDRGSSPSCLKRALDRVLKDRGAKGYAEFKSKLRLSSDDQFGEHTVKLEPPFKLWVDTFRPPVDGKRWYHRFSALTATAGGFDLRRDVLKDHGPLGSLYPSNTTHPQKEGDTMTFLYLVSTGMNDPEQPTWGSWAGRYGRNPDFKDRAYYWANQADAWQGTTHRDNTLKRWAADLQNDFRARLDWCVKPVAEANHAPVVVVNGRGGSDVLNLDAEPGESIKLDATNTADPDGQKLSYEWFVYPEAGTYTGTATITDGDSPRARLTIPKDAKGKSIHVILTVRDNGSPPLARYRRVILNCGEPVSSHFKPLTRVTIADGKWHINGKVTHSGAKAEGLLMNVRMVNAVFEDANDKTRPKGFDPDANTEAFIKQIPNYVASGVGAFTLCLQGGHPGYEDAQNSAFNADGSLREAYLKRVQRVIEACDRHGAAVILGCFYQRQDQILKDESAVRIGVVNVAEWLKERGYTNVVLEIANEFAHRGFDHKILKSTEGEVGLISLAKKTAPGVLVSTSGMGSGTLPEEVAKASDFLLIHLNTTNLEDVPARVGALKKYRKPIVVNEDDKVGADGAKAAKLCADGGASWGFMHKEVNQSVPFRFNGARDDPTVYAMLKHLTSNGDYFPSPESKGGWRKLEKSDDIRKLGGMDPDKLADLKKWLLDSDARDFAAVVIRNGHIVLEVEQGNSAKTDSRRVASVSKAVCATVLAIASEESQQGKTPKKMKFDDPAFDFIPQAKPLSDPRKAKITVGQLLNHTSGICPEATGAKNDGTWEYVLGHSGDANTAKLAFDPGTACGYSTHAFHHASLVCETVTGKPYDEFAIGALFKPIGCEKWWFQFYEGGEKYGKHPSHGMGMPARDLARIAYCMLRGGRWQERQVIPTWFVEDTAEPTHTVKGEEMRFKLPAQTFSHGWQLPARLTGDGDRSGKGIPKDARYKPGSGGQLIAFVPSLDLVVIRQTGSSGQWQYEEYLRRACQATCEIRLPLP